MRQWGNGAMGQYKLLSRWPRRRSYCGVEDKRLYCLIAPLPHCPINNNDPGSAYASIKYRSRKIATWCVVCPAMM
jgi:hypothetical protein